MAARNYVALALNMAVQAWGGDADALETLHRAGSTFGQKIDKAKLGELKAHSQALENLAWGLKELDAEHPDAVVTQDYLGYAMETALKAWEGNTEALELLKRAAEKSGSQVNDSSLAELKAHSQLLENVAWGLKELDIEPQEEALS